tara:strand:- start:1706 stop:1996 length:291 start_codon:yes stop_codon:yes gene_type:complete
MPRIADKKMSGQPKQKTGAPIKHKSPKKQINSKISGKSSSSQRKIVPISKEEEDESFRPTSVRSLERKEAKKEQKKKNRIGKIEKLDRKTIAFAKS